MDFATWLAGTCTFKCAICGERFPHSISFYTHLAAGHRTRPSDYAAKHGSALVHRNTVECAECRETVDHEKGCLQKHFAQRHPGLRLRDYFEQSVRPGQVSQAIDPRPEHVPLDANVAKQQRLRSLSKSGHNKENLSPKTKRDQKNVKDFPILRKMLNEGKSSKCGVCGEAVTGSIIEHLKTKHRKVKMVRGNREKAKEKTNKNISDERAASPTCSEEIESRKSPNSEMVSILKPPSSGNSATSTPEPQAVSDTLGGDKMFKCDSCSKILSGFEAATTHIVDHSHGTFSAVLRKGQEVKEGPGKDCGDEGNVAIKVDMLSANMDEASEMPKMPKHDIFIDRLCMGDEVTLEEDCMIIEDSPAVPEAQEDPLVIEPVKVVQVAKCPLSSACPELLPDERNLTAHLVSTHSISDTRTLDILVAKIKTHFVEI